MSRTTITPAGAICFRTKLLPRFQAGAFARCLQANPRFSNVELKRSERAKNEAYFVLFRPINPQRQGDLYMAEWNTNQQRADEEGADYIYFVDPDRHGVIWVFNPRSGQTWEIVGGHCRCPHKLFRLESAAIHCKHEHELDRRRREGLSLDGSDKVTRTPNRDTSPEAVAARAARCAANVRKDF